LAGCDVAAGVGVKAEVVCDEKPPPPSYTRAKFATNGLRKNARWWCTATSTAANTSVTTAENVFETTVL